MKKILSGLILMATVLASCKKDHSKVSGADNNLYKISFNTGFKQQIVPLDSGGTKKTAATDPTLTANFQLTVIYYVVYDSDGNLVHSIKQVSSDASFGSYTDNLHSGTYTVVVVAGESTIFIGPQPGKLSTDLIFYGNNSTRADFKGDALYKKFSLTVGATNANVDVDLTR